jgi:hypothetical protein
MKDAVEVGSGALICAPSFTETGSGIQKLADISLLIYFFQNEEGRLKSRRERAEAT